MYVVHGEVCRVVPGTGVSPFNSPFASSVKVTKSVIQQRELRLNAHEMIGCNAAKLATLQKMLHTPGSLPAEKISVGFSRILDSYNLPLPYMVQKWQQFYSFRFTFNDHYRSRWGLKPTTLQPHQQPASTAVT